MTNQGNATLHWEIFASGTSQTVIATGTPDFRISDIDGVGGVTNSRESVLPSLHSLSQYTLSSPTNLVATVASNGVQVSGTQDQNGETTSLVGFIWNDVSSWDITYILHLNQAGVQARFLHDGNGDFTFVAPQTNFLLGIDLDADNSTATGTSAAHTFVENGVAQPVVDADFTITQNAVLGTTIDRAHVVLTNPQPGDQLLVGGSANPTGTVNGLSYTISTANGETTVVLTGSATPDAYEIAIKAITFGNSSQNPSATDRLIDVSVTNDTFGTTSNVALSTMHVTPVNDAPVDDDEINSVTEDVTLTVTNGASGDLLNNATDVDSTTLSITGYTIAGVAGTKPVGSGVLIAGVGTITINANGSYSFAPAANYTGAIPVITYTVSDGNGGTDTSTLALSMVAVNDAPVAAPDSGTGPEDSAIVIDVLSNDRDVDNALDPASVIITATPAGATLAIDGRTLTVPGQGVWSVDTTNGAITFTPDANYNGTPTPITYRVTDVAGLPSNTVSVAVTVTPVNDAPIVDLNSAATAADTSRGNATTFTEGDNPLAVAPGTDVSDIAEHDIASLEIAVAGIKDGSFEVVAIGGTSFNAAVSMTTVVTIGGTSFQVAYTARGVGTGTFNITQVGGGAIAQADLDLLVRSVTYRNTDQDPVAGTRTLTFTAKDTSNASSSPAVATITVVPVNDAPVAVNDIGTVSEDGPAIAGNVITGPGADTDVDGGPLTVDLARQGSAAITLGQPFTTAGGGVLTLGRDGSYTFDPGTAYNGLDTGETATETVSYTVTDGNGGTATATLVITINGANDAPVVIDPDKPGTPANPIAATDPLHVLQPVTTTDGAEPAPVDVGAIIKDPDGEPLVFTATGLPPGLSIDRTTGIISGKLPPDASKGGPYTVVVTATDAEGAKTTTDVIYTVVNVPPVALDDTGSVDRGQALRIPVLANDYDGGTDGDPLTIVFASAAHGTAVITADGTITYTPDLGYEGQDVIRYRISDGNGGFADAVVHLKVTADPNTRLTDRALPETPSRAATPERPAVSGSVLDTVRATTAAGATARPGVDGIVVDAVRQITRDIETGALRSATSNDVAGLSSFSLKFTDTSSEAIVAIETFVRQNVLIMQLGTAGFQERDVAVEWKVQRVDGRPMPDWMQFTGRSTLMGERSANTEVVDLRITAILPDGTTVSQEVRIIAPTGEVQPLRLGRQGQMQPFWEQIRTAHLLEQRQIEDLGRFLMAAE